MSSGAIVALVLVAVALFAVFDASRDYKPGEKVGAFFKALLKFAILVAIVAGIGWGIWTAGSWMFSGSDSSNDDVVKYEEAYEAGYYYALDK